MFRLCTKIEIKGSKNWTFDKVVSIEITRDIETLTDICVLELPEKVKWHDESSNPLKRGDSVAVWLGYDDNLELAFRGYITTVGLKSPLSIRCEDEMYLLKTKEAKKKAYKSATIDKILEDQELGVDFKVLGEQNIGQYRVTADTVSQMFAELKNEGIRSFFRLENDKPTLFCGVLFPRDSAQRQVFCTGVNIIDASRLETQDSKDILIKVKAVSLMPDNKRIKVEVGDADGETRTLHIYNKNETELRAWAEQELERLKEDGLVGAFTTFGGVLIDKLDNVGIKIDAERKGVYQVQKNVIKYSLSGFRQEITLGQRAGE